MKVLIIGGTAFLGRHLVEASLARGHEVTIFNRGRYEIEFTRDVERLTGDRASDLSALEGRTWDRVIDTCGFVPRVVRASAELLADKVEHYTFTSSMSVYSDISKPGVDESAPVGKLADESVEEVNQETYGPLKVLCEHVVEEIFPDRALAIRAGLLVGPYDYMNRFGYWPRRVARGGKVLAGGRADQKIQIIDARDLAEWMVRMSEAKQAGTFNASGPDYMLTMGRLLDECKAVTGSDAEFIWPGDKFLIEQKVAPFSELPMWLPEDELPQFAGFMSFDCGKAIAAGLTFRPLAETIRDTLEWHARQPAQPKEDWVEFVQETQLTPERETELIRLWEEQRKE
ncbi:MAG TPA: NAD-dependent epimerase/dehydratase family protein [Blastocatellia bacterium]|nr:NAD-dependent epimerase/dehydratase family protein [Blastocatellia bacterium]